MREEEKRTRNLKRRSKTEKGKERDVMVSSRSPTPPPLRDPTRRLFLRPSKRVRGSLTLKRAAETRRRMSKYDAADPEEAAMGHHERKRKRKRLGALCSQIEERITNSSCELSC